MANGCKQCGSKDNYNFALNIGLCNRCIGENLEQLQAENERLRTHIKIEIDNAEAYLPLCSDEPEKRNTEGFIRRSKQALKDGK